MLATWAATSSGRIPAKGDTGRVVGGLERPAVAKEVKLVVAREGREPDDTNGVG
jgi:hypothetical protein